MTFHAVNSTARLRRGSMRLLAAIAVIGSVGVRSGAAGSELSCSVERADGSEVKGLLSRLTGVGLELDGQPPIPIAEIRSVAIVGGDQAGAAAGSPDRRVRVVLVDGSVILGDDVSVSEEGAAVLRGEAKVAVERSAIATVECSLAGTGAEAVATRAAWLARLEEGKRPDDGTAEGDLVVVGGKDPPEFVECAIVAVAPDAVTVVLDGETIRVKRSKVIGLVWLRDVGGRAPGPAAAIVDVDGGRLLARSAAVEAGELVVETAGAGRVRLAASELVRIDFGSGRRVSLVSSPPERTEVEPWFGLLSRIEGLESHFRPRPARTPGEGGRAREALRVRPRSTLTWRLPEDARRLTMAIGESATVVTVALDDREVYRGSPTTEVSIDAPVEQARKLRLTVDFPTSGPGTGGLSGSEAWLIEPRIER